MKVALVHNIIPPYRVPLFEALAHDPRIDLTVLFMAHTEANRSWRVPEQLAFRHEFLPGLHFVYRKGAPAIHANPSVVSALLRLDPDAVVIGGYDSFTAYMAAVAARWGRRRRLVLWSESNDAGKSPDEGWRAAPKRWLCRRLDAALVPGKRAEAYLRRFCRPDLPFEVLPNIVETRVFDLGEERRAVLRRQGRARLGIEGTVLLFCGQMIERKGFHLLIEAFQTAEFDRPVTLLAVGEGPLREAAERAAAVLGPPRTIRLLPFVQIEGLPELYAASDALVLPSLLDPWPLVVVEAMTAGLPVLCSRAVGNGADLVEEGRTGRQVDTGDEPALRVGLEALTRDDLTAMGRAAAEIARSYCSVDRCVASVARAVGAGES